MKTEKLIIELKLQFNYNLNEIKKKRNELIKIGLEIASELDHQAGSYNDFGFDIGLDELVNCGFLKQTYVKT